MRAGFYREKARHAMGMPAPPYNPPSPFRLRPSGYGETRPRVHLAPARTAGRTAAGQAEILREIRLNRPNSRRVDPVIMTGTSVVDGAGTSQERTALMS